MDTGRQRAGGRQGLQALAYCTGFSKQRQGITCIWMENKKNSSFFYGFGDTIFLLVGMGG